MGGNGATDPYAGLAEQLEDRKRDYLTRLIAPDGTARARGYLLGKHFGHEGKRPEATKEQQAAADENYRAKLVTWYDEPAVRAPLPDPMLTEDVNAVIARLTVFDRSLQEAEASDEAEIPVFTVPFPPEPPPLDQPLDPHKIISLAAQMGVWVPGMVKDVLSQDPTLGAKLTLDQIVDAVASPDPVTAGQRYPVTADTPPHLISIARLLPRELVELIASIRVIKVTGGSGSKDNALPGELKAALDLLACLGDLDGLPLRQGLVKLAKCLPSKLPQSLKDRWIERIPKSVFAFAQMFSTPYVDPPAGWEWPAWNAAGIYWWRAVLTHHVNEHLLAYKDTADFHAIDLLRFYFLFCRKAESPVPSYVRTNVKLGLRLFKYWLDQPAQINLSGDDPYDVESRQAFLVIPVATGAVQSAEMTFWSENHQVLFGTAQYLAGQLFPDEPFPAASADPQAPENGRTMMEQAFPRLERWLDQRLRFGFSEWNSPVYFKEDLTPLFNLVDFVDTADNDDALRLKTKAAMVLDLMVFDFARRTCGGSFGVTAGRAYGDQKLYGWGQSVGDVIELLFGSRGDYIGGEPASIALATSTYDVPEALLAVGRDRLVEDRRAPLVDRSRISINFDEAGQHGIGFDEEQDVVYWWGNGAFFTDKTLEGTKRVVEAHPNLKYTPPFNLLYKFDDPLFSPVIYDLVETAAGAMLAQTGFSGALLPFPLNLLSWSVGALGVGMEIEGLYHLLLDIGATLLKYGEKVLHTVTFGLVGDDDDEPRLPDSAIRKTWEAMLVRFNKGSALTRANLYTYSNGDAMLSSVQRHYPGEFAAQKHAWQATLGCDASVWTTAPLVAPDSFIESHSRAWLEFFKSLGTLRPTRAAVSLYLPEADIAKEFAKDGPNTWTGSLAMPLVVQYENAAIIAYNLPNLQRVVSAPSTHAWFPKHQFDEVSDPVDQSDGTWIFARKDAYDPQDQPMPDPEQPGRLLKPGTRLGSGYVALFSARKVRWTADGPWKDKELRAEGGSNIWVCLVGNEATFGSFENFRQKTLRSYLHISGVGSALGLQCTFDIPDPDPQASPGKARHRLELFYHGGDDGEGHLDGKTLPLDDFPRFENRYVQQLDGAGNPLPGSAVPWGAGRYAIRHARTGLRLVHDLEAAKGHNFNPDLARRHNRQRDLETQASLEERRLQAGSLTTIRLPRRRRRTPFRQRRP